MLNLHNLFPNLSVYLSQGSRAKDVQAYTDVPVRTIHYHLERVHTRLGITPVLRVWTKGLRMKAKPTMELGKLFYIHSQKTLLDHDVTTTYHWWDQLPTHTKQAWERRALAFLKACADRQSTLVTTLGSDVSQCSTSK